jgi:hypothetical protein
LAELSGRTSQLFSLRCYHEYVNNLLESEWLIPANLAVYDHAGAFAQPVITWGLKTRNKIGDLIYIYVSAPESRIAYKCVVEKINVSNNERLGDEFWVGTNSFDPSRNQINIKLLSKLPFIKELKLYHLLAEGLIKAAPQGPRRLDNKLSKFLGDF